MPDDTPPPPYSGESDHNINNNNTNNTDQSSNPSSVNPVVPPPSNSVPFDSSRALLIRSGSLEEESKFVGASSSVILPSPSSSVPTILSPATVITQNGTSHNNYNGNMNKDNNYAGLSPSGADLTSNTMTVDSLAGVGIDSLDNPDIVKANNNINTSKSEDEVNARDVNKKEEDGNLVGTTTPAKASEAANNYLTLMERLRTHWKDCPDVYIQYQNLSYSIRVPIVEVTTPNFLWKGVLGIFNLIRKLDFFGISNSNLRYTDLHAIEEVTGVVEPGTMTLVLAPPGHGKSIYLKSLAGRMSSDTHFSGQVLYNGKTAQEALENGVRVKKLIAYVGQTDIHFPVLTVKETLEFIAQNAIADPAPFNDEKLNEMEKDRAESLIHMLGLEECKDTIVGNDLLRGISGGQRKRVTIGEMLITNARVMLLDEVSTGLDSAVTYHIFHALQQWSRAGRGSIVTALLQPTPETYGLFDKIILMRDGRVVFDGPRSEVRKYFSDYLRVEIPDDADEAGFIVDFLTDPKILLKNLEAKKQYLADKLALSNKEATTTKSMNGHNSNSKSIDEEKDKTSTSTAADTVSAAVVAAASYRPPLSTYASQYDLEEAAANATIKPSDPAITTDEMVKRFLSSPYKSQVDANLSYSLTECERNDKLHLDATKWSDYSQRQFGQDYPHSYSHHFNLAVVRQTKLFFRNMQVIKPRLFQSILMGIVYGTLFYQLNPSDFSSKFGLILYLVMFGAFANLSELPVAAEARAIVTKQVDAGFYPTLPYIFSVIFWNLPLAAVETIIFGTLMYFLTGFYADAGRFFFFLLVMWSSSLSLSTFFRTISYCTPNPDVARQLDFPFIILFIIFGGFLLPYSKIPNWLIWCFWISPFSWGLRSMSLNEFHSARYDYPYDNGDQSAGDYYLSQYDVSTNDQYKWAGVGYLFGFFLVFAIISSLALTYVRAQGQLGTKRLAPLDPQAEKAAEDHQKKYNAILQHQSFHQKENGKTVPMPVPTSPPPKEGVFISGANGRSGHISVPIAAQAAAAGDKNRPPMGVSFGNSSFQMNILPFIPVVLAWTDIDYFVTVGSGKAKKEKQLLRGISGYSVPGTLTALMGSSGAGKTTLMDVIAGRKTVGRIIGNILVNGTPKVNEAFNRLTGYVEQQDLHMGLHTVKEALQFSAHLRLPESITEEQREAWIEEVMRLVGLTRLSHRIIGDAANPGLSPGQLKLVTIAVELVANPSVLFLDEPTSGLDAPSAYRIMKAVRRIAMTGRSVLCTIHQPSAELFYMFDRLLLLRSGGEEVFFSEIGHHGKALVEYFENANPNAKHPPQLPVGMNPANWMLDVIGAGVKSEEGGAINALDYEAADYHALWRSSSLYKQAMKETSEFASPQPSLGDAVAASLAQTYVSFWVRYFEVQKRYFVMHWRNSPTNLTRCVLQTINGLLLGLIYLNISKDDYQGVISFLSVIFLGMAFPASTSAASAFPSLFRQRAVYYRESTIGMYGYIIYSTAVSVVELPFIFFAQAFFMLPFYFMIGLANSGTLFFKFYLVVFVMAVVYSFLSQLWMALLPSQIATNVINGLFMSLFFMFGGLFIKASAMPTGWKWFYYIDPIPKAFIAASLPQFYCADEDPNINVANCGPTNSCPCPTILVANNDGTSSYQYTYRYVANLIEGAESEYWPMIGWLLLTALVIRILNLLALRFISHIKR